MEDDVSGLDDQVSGLDDSDLGGSLEAQEAQISDLNVTDADGAEIGDEVGATSAEDSVDPSTSFDVDDDGFGLSEGGGGRRKPSGSGWW